AGSSTGAPRSRPWGPPWRGARSRRPARARRGAATASGARTSSRLGRACQACPVRLRLWVGRPAGSISALTGQFQNKRRGAAGQRPPARARVRTRTEEQADKILDAAGALFGRLRFHEERMEDIAADAGVGKGTLYRYFKDKEELYLALLKRSSERFARRVHAAAAAVQGARKRLEAVLAAVLAHFDEQPHLFDLIQRAEVMS